MNELRYRLETALRAGSSESQESQEHPLHEMAAYPVCTSESNEATWQNDNNVTIRFSNSLFELSQSNLNLDSAILRLYKYNPNYTDEPQQNNGAEETNREHTQNNKPRRCTNPMLDSQIRVTVSIVRRNKRERKKRICNTIMMDVSKTGWVEIDIKRAIYIWEDVVKTTQNSPHHPPILVGWLMIEVHDEEERPLKPGKYFEPPKCDQAGIAIPWNFYNGPRTALSAFKANDVPKYPRLDVKLIGNADFAPRIENRQLHEQLRENLRRQLNDDYTPQTTNAELENETTLSTSDANLLNAPTDSEFSMQTQEQKQHFRRLHYQKEDSIEPQNERESEISNQHIHRHRRQHNGHQHHHHHHRRHLNHNHAHHHHIQQEQQQQQQQQP